MALIGRMNSLQVVKHTDFGLYLDGGADGEILLPKRYIPKDTPSEVEDWLNVFLYLDSEDKLLFSDYQRHFANIQETLAELLTKAYDKLGPMDLASSITGSGGLTLAKHLDIPFVQEVVAVATSLKDYAPQTDVAIELGGEDAKIIYFTGGVDQRMNGICAGGTGSFIDQMASLLQTDASLSLIHI